MNFKILKQIGSGTISKVYELILEDGKHYCGKFITKKYCLKSRYLGELSALESCKDIPGVVNLHTSFETSTLFVLILEYIPDSITLDKFTEREQHKQFIANELLRIVKELHKISVYHLDIKPHNILISQNRVILIDFDASIREEIKTEFLRGTMSYCPPEGLKGVYGPFTDIYCLGWVLVYVLTGITRLDIYKQHSSLGNVEEIRKMIKNRSFHRIIIKELSNILDRHVSREVKHSIMKMVCYDYKKRKFPEVIC